MIKIEYTSLKMAKSFGLAVKSVCKEEKFLSNSTGFLAKDTIAFVKSIIKNNQTQFYAIENDKVIGWCDIIPIGKEFHSHVGVLGLGIIKGFREKGIGMKLLKTAIKDARKKREIEKIELEVYESNKVAQRIYHKIGFETEGIKKKSKKHKDKYEDVIIMGLLLQ